MGFADRDYAREPQGRPGRFGGGGGGGGGMMRGAPFVGGGFPLITKWLLIINVAVFVIDGLLGRFVGPVVMDLPVGEVAFKPLEAFGYFSAYTAISHGQIWRFLTAQFFHISISHLFFNMLGIFFFGPMIEKYFGSKRFAVFYLLCGVAGPVAYLALWGIGVLATEAWIPLIGASAGVLGILVAAARVAPHSTVYFMFLIPVKLKVLVIIYLCVEVYTVMAMGHRMDTNAGGSAGHLGGAAVGFLFIMRPQLLDWVDKAGDRFKTLNKKATRRRDKNLEAQVDKILDKVKQQGLGSLTEKEKQILSQATDEKRAPRR